MPKSYMNIACVHHGSPHFTYNCSEQIGAESASSWCCPKQRGNRGPKIFSLKQPRQSRIGRLWIMMLLLVNHFLLVNWPQVREIEAEKSNSCWWLSCWEAIHNLDPFALPVLCQVLRQDRNPSSILRWDPTTGRSLVHCQLGHLFSMVVSWSGL